MVSLILNSFYFKPCLELGTLNNVLLKKKYGQTFCDLPTHLHHFYHVFHAIRINKCNFFLLVHSVILGIFSVTLSSKYMLGSVQVI